MRNLTFSLIILLFFSVSVGAQGLTNLRQNLNESNQKLLEYQTSLEQADKKIDELSSNISEKQQELTELKQQISSVDAELVQISERVIEKEQKLQHANQKLLQEQKTYSVVENDFIKSFKIILEKQKSFWQGFLDKLSWQSLIKENSLIDYLAFSNGKAYAKAQEKSLSLLETQQGLELELEDLNTVKKTAETKIINLKTGYQELKAELNKDKLDLAKRRQQIDALKRTLYEQEKQMSKIERELAGQLGTSSFPKNHNATIGWPLDEQGRISSDYGPRIHPIYNEERLHTGVDIAVPSGTPIKAVADGVVSTSGTLNGYGLTVIIDHGQGLATLYGHASKLLVEQGETVRKGQTIALVGSTGLSTGPHVHLEVRENGQHVSPWIWLK